MFIANVSVERYPVKLYKTVEVFSILSFIPTRLDALIGASVGWVFFLFLQKMRRGKKQEERRSQAPCALGLPHCMSARR